MAASGQAPQPQRAAELPPQERRRPLERARVVLADDGQIVVDKSKKFQAEKGEWTNPLAFLKL